MALERAVDPASAAHLEARVPVVTEEKKVMQRVFITGASSGLGAGLARHYAKPGATLGLVARRAALLDDVAKELRAAGATVHVHVGDVVDTAAMRAASERFVSEAGGVDLVVANAGVGIRDALREGNSEEVAQLMQINVIGVTNTLIPFVPVMLAQRAGVLCAISSVAGHRALPGRAAYSASKKAVTTFMDGLRMDLHGSGVHAMTICPGFVHTPLTEGTQGMMFAVDCDVAVRTMADAIEARRSTFTFPWQMNLLKEVMTRAPEWLVRRLAPAPRTRSTL
jgi:short-subunit dehydrogenase